jgi:ABC-2 type transport system ATP-binding protein
MVSDFENPSDRGTENSHFSKDARNAAASSDSNSGVSHPLKTAKGGAASVGHTFTTSTNGSGKAIEVDHIVKKFGEFTAVDDVSFFVKEGEIFGLLGPNGAGKSTLIRMMTTLIPITSGVARISGYDVRTDPDDARRTIGVIPQALTSDIDLTVEENMSIYAKLYDVPAAKRKKAIDELLELVDLTKWRGAQTKTLSGGMRRRLEIARGLVHSPKIFFLDEPTTGLDPVSRVAVWEMLTNIKNQRQLTILITTHYMDEADRLCDRIAIVDHGKLVALDTPPALKASVPGSNVIEAQFENAPSDWEQTLHKLTGVTSVQHEGAGMYRILTGDGSRATTDLVEAAVHAGVRVKSLSVQNTTLDDVFVHYTGRQLRDELVKAYGFTMPSRPGMQP